jgi:HAD superfamily hydrolase (TIGR01549 family)
MVKVKSITFDFWDTLVIDDSDEVKRKELGLDTKLQTRFNLFRSAIQQSGFIGNLELAKNKFENANQRFQHLWTQEHRTPSVAERLGWAYLDLGLVRDQVFLKLVRDIEMMEVEIPPTLSPNIKDCLAKLAKVYKLGIISDTIHTPGWGLRKILEFHEIYKYFSVFVFSDEVSACKPSPVVFQRACELLQTPANAVVHVGDRESNDVLGPIKSGLNAILFTGIKDRRSESTQTQRVCRDFLELPGMLDSL